MGTGTLNTSNDFVGSVKEAFAPFWRVELGLSVWDCTRIPAHPLLILGMTETSLLSVWRRQGEHEGWEQTGCLGKGRRLLGSSKGLI